MKNISRIYFVLLSFLCLFCTTIIAQITPSITASTTSGPAPLAVFFDATETTNTLSLNNYHELCYQWDFGDTSSTWNYSNKNKNEDFGPVAGHTFLTSGVYSVSLTVMDNNGTIASQTINITVEDPDVFFANTNTICISQSGDFTGMPTGATTLMTSNFNDIVNEIDDNKRVLLRREETWSVSTTNHNVSATNGILGAFGSGVDPIIECSATSGALFTLSSGGNPLDRFIFQNLDLKLVPASNSNNVRALTRNGNLTSLTFYQIKMDGFRRGLSLAVSSQIPDKISIVECEIKNATGGGSGGGHGVYIESKRLIFIGNKITAITNGEHNARFAYVDGAVISHNFMSDPPDNKHLIKLHAGSFTGTGPTGGLYVENFIIANNEFHGGIENDWNVTIGPQSNSGDERLRNGIVEKNFFVKGMKDFQNHLIINATDISIRNNLFLMNQGTPSSGTTIRIFQRANEPSPSDLYVYNNTCVRTDNIGTLNLVSADAVTTNLFHNNNLVYAPSATTIKINADGSMGNTEYASAIDPGFIGSTFDMPLDFQLDSMASTVNAGTLLPLCFDFFGQHRSTPFDIGAFEYIDEECPDSLYLQFTIMEGIYPADQFIESDGFIPMSTNTTFKAGNNIELLSDFEVQLGAEFTCEIESCN